MKHLRLDTFQYFLSKLGIKPLMHLLKISNFFTKSCHRQTYQNYEQKRQKLDTFLENNVLQKSKFSKKNICKSWSPSLIFFKEKKFRKIRLIFDAEK